MTQDKGFVSEWSERLKNSLISIISALTFVMVTVGVWLFVWAVTNMYYLLRDMFQNVFGLLVILGSIALVVNAFNGAGYQYMEQTVTDIVRLGVYISIFERAYGNLSSLQDKINKGLTY